MKQISGDLSAALAGEVVTLSLCWRLRRADGIVVGATDHDCDLIVDGVTYQPGVALEAGRFTQSSDLKPGRGAVGGALSIDAISDADLDAGLWDRCRVDVYRVDWTAPEHGGIPVWSGFLNEITRSATGVFEAELISLKAELERPVGRILQRRCDALLGDARCGVTNVAGRTCDQRFETCLTDFSNTENYRGFPHMPGTDFVLAGPALSGNDGGKR